MRCCTEYKPGDMMAFLAVFIKISNHLALILPADNDTAEQLERNRRISSIAFPDGAPSYGKAIYLSQNCGKWQALEQLLDSWLKDRLNKVLIFTKSRKLLSMLEFHLQRRCQWLDFGFASLHYMITDYTRSSSLRPSMPSWWCSYGRAYASSR